MISSHDLKATNSQDKTLRLLYSPEKVQKQALLE